MKLFLTSFFSQTGHKLADFVGESLTGKSVTFIPTAANIEPVTHFIDSAMEAFTELGIKVDLLDIALESFTSIQAALQRNDFIYVSGGNTFYLLQILKEKGADRLLVEAVQNGKVYIGESAGIIILAPDIGYSASMEDLSKAPKLQSHTGLGLIDFYPLPHKNNDYFKDLVENIIQKFTGQINLVPITDKQVITYSENTYKIIA